MKPISQPSEKMRRAGRVLLWAALAAAALAAGLFEHFALTRQRLQFKADVAAESGARALIDGTDVRQAADKRLSKSAPGFDRSKLQLEWPPLGGRLRGRDNAVRVIIPGEWRPPLVPRSLFPGIAYQVRSTAAAVPLVPGQSRRAALRIE